MDTYSEGDQYLLSISQRKAIIECYRNSNALLNRMYFPDKNGLFPEFELGQVDKLGQIDNSYSSVDMDLVRKIYCEAKIFMPKR